MAFRLLNLYEIFRTHTRGDSPRRYGERPVQRGTSMAEPSQEALESVQRELTRSAAIETFEHRAAEPSGSTAAGADGNPNAG